MPRTCNHCRRANPVEAAYCYYDGALLDGATMADGTGSVAIDVGARPFGIPFVFPSGRICHNFNQLAVACREDPAGARELLVKGYLESFLGAQGRADLASAAYNAAQAADPARGLDEFLGRLPGNSITPPRLRVEREVIDLGVVPHGEDQLGEFILFNEGARLLTGSAVCDDKAWLCLGEGEPLRRKQFQVADRTVLPFRIRGRYLGAYRKPQLAEVRLESNGGTVVVTVRVEVPVVPFPEGVLAGALSPRQMAEKARALPREAAVLIEKGAVAHWYRTNGWAYPVRGPGATGMAAVQQLFEALGLVRSPRVELSEDAVRLQGAPGTKLEYVVAVVSQENRAAVAHATSDQPWLQVGPTIFRGRSAFLPLTVPAVPLRAGETLQARLTVTGNGGQRFTVPVTLAIGGGGATPARLPPIPTPAPPSSPDLPRLPPIPLPPPPPPRSSRRSGCAFWARVLVAGVGLALAVGLGILVARHLFPAPSGGPPTPEGPEPLLTLAFQDDAKDASADGATMTFGLVLAQEKGAAAPDQPRRLTFDPRGRTNNTCYRVDGRDVLLGSREGRWEVQRDDAGRQGRGCRSVWLDNTAPIAITQDVKIVTRPGSARPDTCRVQYTLHNRDKVPHKVGLRFLLDTYVGGRDGVPFLVPGAPELCITSCDRRGESVPDFIEALEKPDLKAPGAVAHLDLRPGSDLEPPDHLMICPWPDEKLHTVDARALGRWTRWDVPVLPLKAMDDSAVTLYWEDKELAPGGQRTVGFTYGLGSLSADSGGGRLALTAGGSFLPGGVFTLVAYVSFEKEPPREGETLTLKLSEGLTLVEGDPVQSVPGAGPVPGLRPVRWRLRSANGGPATYQVEVQSSTGATQGRTITIVSR